VITTPEQLVPTRSRPSAGRGILTLAHGERRYITMAKVLAETLRMHCGHIPRALITDSADPALANLYDIRIPLQPEFGKGLQQKLYLDIYTPFEETLFIDSDCLVVRTVEGIWPLFAGTPVGVIGGPMRDGYWFGDIASIRSHFGLDSIPRFNSGMLYFDRGEETGKVFATAREIMRNYDTLGFTPMRGGGRNDEPVLAVALAIHGVSAIDDGGSTMRTPIGLRGPLSIDVLRGTCHFNKDGTQVEPAIAHFCGWRSRGFHYRREQVKLHLAAHSPLPTRLISHAVNAICNPPYAIGVAAFGPAFRLLEHRYKQRTAMRRRLMTQAESAPRRTAPNTIVRKRRR
jgi:hypothetical protein